MMTKDGISDGMGLHGQAVLVAIDLFDDIRRKRPQLAEVAALLNVSDEQLREIFPDDEALLIAVGEQALIRLIDASTKAIVKVQQDDPVGQFTALGDAFVTWVARHPAQYRLIADQSYLGKSAFDHLRRYLDSLNTLMERILLRAQDNGTLAKDQDVRQIVLSSRIFATGLADMLLNQRLAEWDKHAPQVQTARRAMQYFVRNFARGTPQRAPAMPDRSISTATADH